MTNQKTLRDALTEGDLESFIKEHEDDPEGDLDKVEEVIRRTGAQSKVYHASDCAGHNAPAMKPGSCDCGAEAQK